MSELLAPDISIAARDLQKRYRLGQRGTLGSVIRRAMQRGVHVAAEPFDALRGVTFDVYAGECFGIVGGNGSGKSTFLQLVSGITVPTSGSLTVRGRVLPLLAIGSGFHPELTGRENVRLFGAILGISQDTVATRMADIIAFAELERHIDTPNKRYSDGMQSRLSFAVAMMFPADVYIFDEVLAVVDGDFRGRCLGEIARLRSQGSTVLFVSHDADQVRALCDRVVWLEKGTVRALGSADHILDSYEHLDAAVAS